MTDYLYPTPFPREPVESSPGKFPSDLAAFGRWVLVIYGSELPSFVRDALDGFEGGFHLFEMSGAEPSPLEESVGVGAAICRHERLDAILALCDKIRSVSDIKIRLNTNGLSDLICDKVTAPLFQGRLDSISISLNASTPEKYDALCHSRYGLAALPAIIQFTKDVKQYVPYVRMTVVDTMDDEELSACRALCETTGADFVVRHYEPDWADPKPEV